MSRQMRRGALGFARHDDICHVPTYTNARSYHRCGLLLPFYVIDESMKVYGTVGDLVTSGPAARALEGTGFDGVWAGELNDDPFLSLTLAANATTTLELGTSVAVAFARSPMTLAYTANELQRFSQGRLTVGLGSQVKAHITRRFGMPWDQPLPRMREYVHALRAIWESWSEGSKLAFEGDYYNLTLMPQAFIPRPHAFGAPKLLLAGVGDAMSRLAGEVADGFMCHFFSTERWIRERTIPALVDGARAAGRTLEGFELVAGVFLVSGTAGEMEQALPATRAQIAFYASTPSYRPILEMHGWGSLGEELTRLSKQSRWAEMACLIDDDMVDAFAIVARPEDLAASIEKRFGDLLTHLSFMPPPLLGADAISETVRSLKTSNQSLLGT